MIKNQYRMNKRKNSLAQKIIGLLIILVMAGMLEIGFGFVLLDCYRTEIRNMETTVLNSYITRTNQTFNMINSNVRSLLLRVRKLKISQILVLPVHPHKRTVLMRPFCKMTRFWL